MAFILFILYAPIATLIVLSFNASKSRAKWGGFTTRWYVSLFHNADIMQALYTTLYIALISAAVATVIGTLASIGIHHMKNRPRQLFMGITNIPLLNSDIVMGVSLMLLFIIGRIELGFATILLAHITFDIPYVIISVMPKLKQTERSVYEAALDLGATPLYAFRKTVLPDIMPGIFSGFLLAFTMSLDDFVITHFTKGPGIDTLSTKIYSEVRKGIRPEINALSTIVFMTVLVLLLVVNMSPEKAGSAASREAAAAAASAGNGQPVPVTGPRRFLRKRFILGRVVPVALIAVLVAGAFYYGGGSGLSSDNTVVVYNYGDYLDPVVLEMFEEETGIKVLYEEYETNEIMYPKLISGAVAYDVVFPADYMIEKMIQQDLIQPINHDNIPNLSCLGEVYMQTCEQFDPGNKYAVPYVWGTVGILYNTTMVDEPVTSWKILWDTKYKDSILMQDSVRDALGVALKYLGYSMNSTNMQELTEAEKLLESQKPLVQAYVMDQARDKMIGNEAALAVIYSGDALYAQMENEDLEYVVPDEGSNVWVDAMVIPKNAKHKENAEKFIDFMCRTDITLINFDYLLYSIPNVEAEEEIEDEELRENEILFPDDEVLERCETFSYLGQDAEVIYNDLWNQVKSS